MQRERSSNWKCLAMPIFAQLVVIIWNCVFFFYSHWKFPRPLGFNKICWLRQCFAHISSSRFALRYIQPCTVYIARTDAQCHFQGTTIHRTYMHSIDPLFILLSVCLLEAVFGSEDEFRLIQDLRNNYDPIERPVRNHSEPIRVKLRILLQQLVDVVSE